MIKTLSPTSLIAIPVDLNTADYFISSTGFLCSRRLIRHVVCDTPMKDIGIFKKEQIVGEVIKARASFDVKPFLKIDELFRGEPLYETYGKYYSKSGVHTRILSTSNDFDAFMSLLEFNGVYFYNKMGSYPSVYKKQSEISEYNRNELKLVKKVVILSPQDDKKNTNS